MFRKRRHADADAITFAAQLSHELEAVDLARSHLKQAHGASAGPRSSTPRDVAGHQVKGTQAGAFERAHDRNLLGLALSGGGIRSATFNLGVIQRLAKLRLLHHVDYLSTVSGGGYIGGWLSAWVHREQGGANDVLRPGILGVEERLGQGVARTQDLPSSPEPRQVRWLREFSNYLTPRIGALSTDTLTGVATYLRNLILNQAILITFGGSLLVLPWALAALLPALSNGQVIGGVTLAALLLLGGSFVAGYETLRANVGPAPQPGGGKANQKAWERAEATAQRAGHRYWVLFSCFAAAAAIGGILMTNHPGLIAWWLMALFGGAYGVGTSLGWWVSAYRVRSQGRRVDARDLRPSLPVWGLIAGMALGLLVWVWTGLAGNPSYQLASPLPAVALGPVAILGAILLTITLHLGLAGRRLREAGRELWSGHGAHQMRFGATWLVFAGAALFGPLALIVIDNWIAALGGVTWVFTTAAGVLAGTSPTTGGRGSSRVAEIAARIGPYVFVLGVLLIVSYGVYRVMWWQWPPDGDGTVRDLVCERSPRQPAYELHLKDLGAVDGTTLGRLYEAGAPGFTCLRGYLQESAVRVAGHWHLLLGGTLSLLLAALFLSRRVDVNVYSFHMFYRNRIERCYLGASNLGRRPHPLTGLDATDAPRLRDLVLQVGAGIAPEPSPARPSPPLLSRALNFIRGFATGTRTDLAGEPPLPAQRPIPIINAALNITSSRNLAWQERKAASFTFTPMYSGYEIREPDGKPISCYQGTPDYVRNDEGWISLGLPITISGAAASPNAGYHTSAATAFLLTVFNVRLGWWLQNPRYQARWRESGPKLALFLFLQELFGMTTDESEYVYLSDGGHFENLGIYELVRRRCRYIIACDAGCDPKWAFEDLGNAVRKVQIDLGIDIEIDPRGIPPDSVTGRSRCHCAVGRIHYERVDEQARPGYLLYIKTSLTGDEPADVLQYAAVHAAFPHETTADQWYSESQFESYRKLGYHAAGSVLADAIGARGGDGTEVDLEDVFAALSERWYPPSPESSAMFSKHGEAVEAIFERIRKDEALRFLDQQIYPEWWHLTDDGRAGRPAPNPRMLPEHAWEIRAGFYLCNSLLQVMENVYHDLNLEERYAHPDNRGWMNLFRHWAWAGMLRVTWAISASMFGARFQRFCRRRLGLGVGEVCCAAPVPLPDKTALDLEHLKAKAGLNFIEAEHVQKIVKTCFAGREGSLSVAQLSLRVVSPFDGNDRTTFSFPFAFALIDESGAERTLLYYRVRDHLREIGLGRKGLAVLFEEGLAERMVSADAGAPRSLWTVIPEADYPAVRRLWTSVVVAKEERSHRGLERRI
jgi:hypothetical protein